MAIKASATITLTSYRDTQSVTRYYKLQPAGSSAPLKPETKPPSSDWTDSEPACDISKELYFCDLTIFSNGEGEYSSVSKSSSYEAAKQAYNRADNAQKSIDNLELTKIDRFGTNASMKWDGNILKIEAVDPETNVPYAVEIGGNGIEFKYDSEAVAMINQDQLVIDKTVVLTEMQVNRYWTWRTRDNNNLCLQWIGGSN